MKKKTQQSSVLEEINPDLKKFFKNFGDSGLFIAKFCIFMAWFKK